MKKETKEFLKFLFPEYQIVECVAERGFIAKSYKEDTYVPQAKKKNVSQDKQRKVVDNQNSSVHVPKYKNANIKPEFKDYLKGDKNSAINPELLKRLEEKKKADAKLASKEKTSSKTNEKANKQSKGAKTVSNVPPAFDELDFELKKCWIGSENDINALSKAFKRPYVVGFDNVKPKNAILIIGSESRGKRFAVNSISQILKKKKVFRYSKVSEIDMTQYAADSENTLFLSDLYKALNKNTEVVLFDNIEKSSLLHLDILYQLLSTGVHKLSGRYMMCKEGLMDATGVLNTNLISELSSNGKYFVFTTTMSKSKVVSVLGNKMIKEIGDIICLDPIEDSQINNLVRQLCCDITYKCNDNLCLNVSFWDSAINNIANTYSETSGIQGLINFINENIYDPLSEMKLQEIIADGDSLCIEYDNGYCIQLEDDKKLYIEQYTKNYNKMELEEVKKELNNVIGLNSVKEFVLDLENNYKVQQMRTKKGLKNSDISMHMIFTGNPGTGKTTIARIVAKYLKAIGILSSGHLCEVTRADLVGEYVGHTAIKTTNVINGAVGGVLFIDEAYSLCRDKNDTFGLEAIDALVKGIEDNRNDLVVILAGYEDEMQEFLKTNSGLKSRFPNVVHFEDYSVDEMYEIAKVTAESKGYHLSPDCEQGLRHVFEKHQIKGRNDSGNGRLVRNIIEAAIVKQSKRIINDSNADIELLEESDFGFDKVVEFDLEKSLSEIIGLEEVKKFIRTQYSMLQADIKRKSANINVDTTQSLNMIFAGNPGTGKTTMARIVAKMLHAMDILKSGQLVETDKGALIASYEGQTAKKTEEVFKSALGGVLFIDEAYAITNDGSSFGQECIDTLVKLIEDYRGEIVVILAGYSKEMNYFMKANSGLKSRFPLQIEFPDYTADELYRIGKRMIADRGFVLDENADNDFADEINILKSHSDASSGNGRMVRNFVEDIIRRQSSRVAMSDVSGDELITIISQDINPEEDNKGFDLEQELAKVIGLESVKHYIRSLNARLKMQEKRKKAGLKTDKSQTMHMIFAGNPGTGKTMMARTVANVLYNMNVIHTNKLVETDRSGLVAGYVGQTAIKTREVIESALDGVLFIDEAYALAQGGENDFGQEAIDTLVKMMDDNRDRLVVILAGYSEDMMHFLDKNVGLQSRFANIIEFPDYSTDELLLIADELYSEQGYVLSESGKKALREKIDEARHNKKFGNGRYVRNIYERSLNNQALRLSNQENCTTQILSTITEEDIREA